MGAINEPVESLYEADFVTWTEQQAAALKRGDWAALDIPNLVEEVESMGRQQQAELTNRLAALLAHLLKWQHQPAVRLLQGRSWSLTVVEQRKQIAILIRKNPSLKSGRSDGRCVRHRPSAGRAGVRPCPRAFPRDLPLHVRAGNGRRMDAGLNS